MDENSLTHTTWDCKYHIVFAPKYKLNGQLTFDDIDPFKKKGQVYWK